MSDPPRGRVPLRFVLDRFAPQGSQRRAALRIGRAVAADAAVSTHRARASWRLTRTPRPATPDYGQWLADHRLTPDQAVLQATRAKAWKTRSTIGCVVLAARGGDVRVTLESLRTQTLGRWTAVVVDEADRSRPRDDRVTFARNGSEALTRNLEALGPDAFVLVLEAGDVLEPDLLFSVVAAGYDNPTIELVHWDDDLLTDAGALVEPRFKPAWSPETLLCANYIGRSFAVRRRRLATQGSLRTELGDGSWWELLLRLGLDEGEVARVPRVLQHLAHRPGVKADQGRELVAEHLRASGEAAQVDAAEDGVRVRWEMGKPPRVTVVIPTRHNRKLLSRCVASLKRTDYPLFDVVIVDSGERRAENEEWHRETLAGLAFEIVWWEGPFNFSAACNAGARAARGEVLIFLNDDIEATDPGWMRELVGWATRAEIGLAGLQLLDGDGRIQHAGVVVGLTGFAGHPFAGLAPGSDTIFGHTAWTRNWLSVTAACVALERTLFESVGGFDERFTLCGSDVVLGLDTRHRGLRNVCSTAATVRHLEAATRGSSIPRADFHASYWRYQRWLRGGDPYHSPNLSVRDPVPRLRPSEEPDPITIVGGILDRDFSPYRQLTSEEESRWLARHCLIRVPGARAAPAPHADRASMRTVNWFLPEMDNPFYGGVNTALRIADHLASSHEVENRFVFGAAPQEEFLRSALTAAFPSLANAPIAFTDGRIGPGLAALPEADAAIATYWGTAYLVAAFPHAARRFYLIQDFEPMFYPAGTNYALAEESYRLGLYGLCNSPRLLDLYRDRYGGEGTAFLPAVDTEVFHARDRRPVDHDGPATVFVYARPGHWRNCWELAAVALEQLKERLGSRVRIVTAGSWARPDDLGSGIEHLGLLDYRDTGVLYRSADVGVALTVSEHPSYLPLELLACGTPVVAFDNPAGDWILHHERNSLRCPRTADGLAEALARLASDPGLRRRLSEQGLADIAARHSDWSAALSGIYGFIADPVGAEVGAAA